MPLEPFVQAQDLVVEDDDGLVVRNEPFNLAARKNAFAAHGGGLGWKQTHEVSEGGKNAPGDWARERGRARTEEAGCNCIQEGKRYRVLSECREERTEE